MQVRLKVKDWFSIRALPNQIVKVNKRWQLGNSPVALRVNYECPLDNLANPLRAPARLMVRWAPTYDVSLLCKLFWSSEPILARQEALHPIHSTDVGRKAVRIADIPAHGGGTC